MVEPLYTAEEMLPFYEAYCREYDKQEKIITSSGLSEQIEPKEPKETFFVTLQTDKPHWNIRKRSPQSVAQEYVRDQITNIDEIVKSWNAMNNAFGQLTFEQRQRVDEAAANGWSDIKWNEHTPFTPEDLEEAYKDFQTLRSIFEKYTTDDGYKAAMIYLFWTATKSNKLVHQLYSPDDERFGGVLF